MRWMERQSTQYGAAAYGLDNLRSIRWRQLRPGMVIVGGIEINDSVPYELRDFPVLNADLLNDLSSRYQFLAERRIVVADAALGFRPGEVSERLSRLEAQLRATQIAYHEFQRERERLETNHGIDPGTSVFHSRAVELSYLLQDRSNSFSVPYAEDADRLAALKLPSAFFEPELKRKIGELLIGRLSGSLNIPDDRPVTLHLVVDYSFSMAQHGKLEIAASAANYLAERLPVMFGNTRVKLYAFSDECRLTDPPFSGKEVRKGDTSYASFFGQVLKNRSEDRHNKLIVITDGTPTDFSMAMKTAELIRRARIDYTQIMLSLSETFDEITSEEANLVIRDRLVDPDSIPGNATRRSYTPEEVEAAHRRIGETFTSIADACNGNQIILTVDPALKLVMAEVFDRYLGLMTLAESSHPQGEALRERAPEVPQVRTWKWT